MAFDPQAFLNEDTDDTTGGFNPSAFLSQDPSTFEQRVPITYSDMSEAEISAEVQAMRKQGATDKAIDNFIDRVGISKEDRELLDKFDEFSDTKLGKLVKGLERIESPVTGLLNLVGFPAKTSRQQLEEIARNRSRRKAKNTSLEDVIKEEAMILGKEGLQAGAAAAQFLLSEVSAPAKIARILPGRAGQVGGQAITQAGIQAPLAILRNIGSGESVGRAFKSGLIEGGIEGGIIAGVPLLGQIVKLIKKPGAKALAVASGVSDEALDLALKNPQLLEEGPDAVISIGNTIKENLKEFSKIEMDVFGEGLDKIKELQEIFVDANKFATPEVQKILDEGIPKGFLDGKLDVSFVLKDLEGINKKELSKRLSSQAKRELLNVSDDAIERMINGEWLFLEEARDINKLFSNVVNSGQSQELGSGAIGRIANIKRNFLNGFNKQIDPKNINKIGEAFFEGATGKSIGNNLKSLKDINARYAEATTLLENVRGNVIKKSGDINESAINQLAEGALKGRKKFQELDRLTELDEKISGNVIESLKKFQANKELSKSGIGSLYSLIKTAMVGGSAGMIGGGPFGAIFGALASNVPPKEIIKGINKLPKTPLKFLKRKPGRIIASKESAKRLLRRLEEGEE